MNNIKNEINLFIGFTPYHSLVCKKIIEETEDTILCIFTKGWPQTIKKYHKIGYFPQNKILRTFFYPLSLLLFSIYIKKFLRKKCINVYIPHPKNPFTNFTTYTKVNSINIYEDGIMNYYDANSADYIIKDLNIKLMKLCKLKYKDYQGHLTGLEFLKINKYYLSRPDFAVLTNKAQKKVCLYVLKSKNSLIKKRILFLDQRTDNFFSRQIRNEKLKIMFSIYSPSEYEYLYKPHHDYSDNFLTNKISKNLEAKPAEELVELFSPDIVISFFSSALINIKMSNPNIKCYWLAANMIEISRNRKKTNLSCIFTEANVINIEKSEHGIH
jgi:hypothetical protein